MVARSHGGGAECHFFFFNDTPPPEIYPLSLHAALPIFNRQLRGLLFDPEPPAAPAEGWSAVTHVDRDVGDRKSTRLNSSHSQISYAVFCLKKKEATPGAPPDSPCGSRARVPIRTRLRMA